MFVKLQLRSILRPVLIFLFLMSFYQVLVSGKVVPASEGVSLIQNNKDSGAKVVLFDLPLESRVNATLRQKQIRALAKKLFPPDCFEWLPPPPPQEWRTNDGIHLIRSDARDFAEFLRDKLLG